jgi:hypothetical protein
MRMAGAASAAAATVDEVRKNERRVDTLVVELSDEVAGIPETSAFAEISSSLGNASLRFADI